MDKFAVIMTLMGLTMLSLTFIWLWSFTYVENKQLLKRVGRLNEEIAQLRHERAKAGQRAMALERKLHAAEKLRYESWEKLKLAERRIKSIKKGVA